MAALLRAVRARPTGGSIAPPPNENPRPDAAHPLRVPVPSTGTLAAGLVLLALSFFGLTGWFPGLFGQPVPGASAPVRRADASEPPPVPEVPALSAQDQQFLAPVSAPAFIVVDAATGSLLYGRRAHDRIAPASLTKIVTALLVIERGNLDQRARVPQAVLGLIESTLMGLVPGDRLSLRDLLYGLMLPSGNDAAVTLAVHVGGSEETFVRMMNQRAEELGLRNTSFANAHGLDAPGHYSSAYDLALLTRTALALPEFRAIVNAPAWTARGETEQYPVLNGNPLLQTYAGADGVKIGFTDDAGETIVGSAVRNGRRLIAVALRSDHRVLDASLLLDLGFSKAR